MTSAVSFLAIDPGNEQSALIELDDYPRPVPGLPFGKYSNETARQKLNAARFRANPPTHLAIEMIAHMGMPAGRELFETAMWVGRFVECWGGPFTLVYRNEVKLHICGTGRAKDSNIRQALIDRYGGDRAIGNKKTPGPLYLVSGDVWQALAVGVTWFETRRAEAA